MKNTVDYKSRFRILKGGKISLVVSALLVGSIMNVAQATDYTIDNNTTQQDFTIDEYKDITLSGNLNITNTSSSGIYISGSAPNHFDLSIEPSGSIDMNTTEDYNSAIAILLETSDSSIVNNGSIKIYSQGESETRVGIDLMNIGSSIMYDTSIINNGLISIDGDISELASGIEIVELDDLNISNLSISNNDEIKIKNTNSKAETTGILISTFNVNDGAKTLTIEDSNITNSSAIAIDAVGDAYGIRLSNETDGGYININNSSITNSGTIDVNSSLGNATGISIYSYYTNINNSSIDNQNSISVISETSDASGIYVGGDLNASSITNASGASINVQSNDEASGIQANSLTDSSITNAGTVDVNSTFDSAYGIKVADLTNSSITNSLGASINTQGSSNTSGIEAQDLDNSSITNAGTIDVNSTNSLAYGIVVADLTDSSITNSLGASINTQGSSNTSGIEAQDLDNSSITNAGTIDVNSTNSSAYGIKVVELTNQSSIQNSANLTVTGVNQSYGIKVLGQVQNSSISNSATITVNAERAYGIQISGDVVSSHISNSGIIDLNATDSYAIGMYIDNGLNTNSSLTNTANIIASAVKDAYGMKLANIDNNSSLENSGDMKIDAADFGYGLIVENIDNDSYLDNTGDIVVDAGNDGTGIKTAIINENSYLKNSGDIRVNVVDGDDGFGIRVEEKIDNTSYLENSGDIRVYVDEDSDDAYGIRVDGEGKIDNYSYLKNSGDMTIEAESDGYGIRTLNIDNNSYLENTGNMTVNANGTARGISANFIDNNSTLSSNANLNIRGVDSAYGVRVDGIFNGSAVNISGEIKVDATVDDIAGIFIDVQGGREGMENGTLTNAATVIATKNDIADFEAYSLHVASGNAASTITNTGKLYGNILVGGNIQFTNEGLISLPYNATGSDSALISNFTQTSTGILEIGLMTDGNISNTTHSKLVTENATFANGSTLAVNVLTTSTNQDLLIGETLTDVVTADTSLTLDGTLKVTDNSALLNFEYFTSGYGDVNATHTNGSDGAINLNIVKGQTILGASTAGLGNKNTQGAARALDKIQESGSTTMNGFFANLNALPTDAAVARAVQSTTPLTAGANAGAGTQVMSGMQGIVEMRQNVNVGMNSGDALLSDKNVWMKPYFSSGSQNDKDGINGFALRTSGFGIGVDGEYASGKKIGLAIFYTKASVDVNDVTQSSDMDVLSTLIYGNIPMIDDKTNFLYQVGYAWQKTSSSRTIDIALGGGDADADYTSTTATLDLKLMRNYNTNDRLLLQPMIQATYRRYDNPSYSESGATDTTLNMHTDSFSTNEIVGSIGTLAHYKLDEDSRILASANVGYDFNNDIATVSASYAGALGTTFDTEGIDNGRWNYTAGIGYEMKKVLGGELNFMYDYQAKGTDFRNNTLSAKYVMAF